MKKFLIGWMLGLSSWAWATTEAPEALFEAGNAAYAEGDFETAVELYSELVAEYVHFEGEYNLANSHFKLNQLGPAILHYERAREIQPGNPDVISNLTLANARVSDRIETLPSNGLSDLWERVVAPGFFKWYARVFLVLWTLGFIAFAWRLFAVDLTNRRLLGSVGTALLILGLLAGWLTSAASARIDNSRRAIVMESVVDVWSAPSSGTDGKVGLRNALFVLHEGTKVRLLDVAGDWQEIELENGQVGWLPKAALGEI
jgi:tetratricopeptide (TPR) repeat protein